MRWYGSSLFLRGLWSDITGESVDVHIRTDANNLVATASTTHDPEQKETMCLIQKLLGDIKGGQMHDLALVRIEDCLADSVTKHSAKAYELSKAVLTSNLLMKAPSLAAAVRNSSCCRAQPPVNASFPKSEL